MLTSPLPPEILEEGLDPSIVTATSGIATACAARAALLCLATPEVVCWIGGRPKTNVHLLADFAHDSIRQRSWSLALPQVGGCEAGLCKPLGEGGLALVKLHHEGQYVGTLALDLPGADWQARVQTLYDMAPLAAIVVASSQALHLLELELSEASERADRLLRASQIDDLTSLENKASFETKCIARLNADLGPAAMLALDLDSFKQVNDVYGHLFGDKYLQTISGALKQSMPGESIIGRIGGDEFGVLLNIPVAGRPYLDSIVRNLRHAIQRSMATLGKPDLGGLSIGVSLFPEHASNFRDLLELADCALYASKRSSRNKTTFYTPDLDGLVESATLRDSRKAFEFARLVAQVQPIVEIRGRHQTGVEVLARWQDQNGRLKTPESFAWVFRDHRYASQVTFHVVESALRQLCPAGRVPDADLPNLWINVTDGDFLNPDFVFDLQAILERYDVDWSKIVLEVNEDTILGSRNGLVYNALKEVRRRGGRVALDDFGAGHTGLTHACHWPVDIIKLDRSIVQQIGLDHRADAMVRAIVLVAVRLNQTVLAEGIETEQQARNASDLGCRLGQGFHFGRPCFGSEIVGRVSLGVTEQAL